MTEQMRLDAALVSRGLIGGRDRAKELIANGSVLVNGKVVKRLHMRVHRRMKLHCCKRRSL